MILQYTICQIQKTKLKMIIKKKNYDSDVYCVIHILLKYNIHMIHSVFFKTINGKLMYDIQVDETVQIMI